MKDIILYHGTDARILRMTDEERASFKADSILAADYMWQFYEPYRFDFDKLKEPLGYNEDIKLWDGVTEMIICYGAKLSGNEQYQYDNVYMTSNQRKAEDYAYFSFAFGEIGRIAYRFWQGAQKIHFQNWNPTHEVESAMKRIADFAKGIPEPILLEFHVPQDIVPENMRYDNGGEINWEYTPELVRCIGEVSFNNAKRITLEPRNIEGTPIPPKQKMEEKKKDFLDAHLERLDKRRERSLQPKELFFVKYRVIRGCHQIGEEQLCTKLSEYEIKLLWASTMTDDSLTQNRLSGKILQRLEILAKKDAQQKHGGNGIQVSAAIELEDLKDEFDSYLQSIES